MPTLKLTVERAALLRSLGRLQGIVEKRHTVPILANVKLETIGSDLRLTVTDMDIVASERIPIQTTTPVGGFTVPAVTLYDIIRKLPEGSEVEIETEESTAQAILRAGNARFALSYLPAEEFPVMSEGSMTHRFVMSAKALLRLIAKTRFAMSVEETRYYLNGVYLHVTENQGGVSVLRAVATDGHRLARVETALPEGAAGMPGVILPRKTVNELHRLLEEQAGDIEVAVSEAKVRFSTDTTVLLSKLIDGTFPDYVRVIPTANNRVMEVDAAILTQAVDRVATVAAEKTRGVRFGLMAGKLTLNTQGSESNSGTEELEINYSGGPFEIGFNARYVGDMMAQLEGETVQFRFADAVGPTLANDPADVTTLYVIMPMGM